MNKHPRHEDDNDSYYDSDSEAYNDMFGVNDHWSDKALLFGLLKHGEK